MAKGIRRRRRVPKALTKFGGLVSRDPGGNPNTTAIDTAEVDPAINAMIEQIKARPIADWGIFTTHGPIATTAQKPDGTYRTVPLAGTEEFTFADLYVGKRGSIIFRFAPIDPTYTAYEFPEDKVFTSIPALEGLIVGALGGSFDVVFDRPGEGYSAARSQFCAKFRRAVVVQKKAEEVAKVEENVERQKADPRWGMF